MAIDQPADPRPAYAAATTWVADLLAGVTDTQLDGPTPCDEFDVRTLMRHLIGTGKRGLALAEGTDILAVPPIDDRHDAATYAEATGRAVELLAGSSRLGEIVTVPWGQVPLAAALWGYISEALTHGWDLAVATGQNSEADPAIVEPTLAAARQFIPAEIRTLDDIPFGPVVEPRAEAGLTERLANWTGRTSANWIQVAAS
ncbi:TIGR03086 family metal-binding protein [Nocardia macrotermitis]|uniref:Mycothiol-dependent maleylpyruvate isomerase metal-binding domain-containing protein n=1 Tax=Nocardia macrotermitis TaxID=2585198 RepID=A0A7K0D3Z7_9NOCA|nr:TIGR03086 family metal-binding protein [Nocardia macrotermitis]MQY20407.1 hypothetical protein [Nocardia macrotermitis]